MSQPKIIRNFIIGDTLTISRRVPIPSVGNSLVSAVFTVSTTTPTPTSPIFSVTVDSTQTSSGQVIDSGAQPPNISQMLFQLSSTQTLQLSPNTLYGYIITATFNDNSTATFESGYIIGGSSFSGVSYTAKTTTAPASIFVGGRTANIIDNYLDAILGDYRQLKVWDEHARRTSPDPLTFKLTYEHLNPSAPVEVFNGQNQVIDPRLVSVDYGFGTFFVIGDDGNQDYYVTYHFDFFPEEVLSAYVNQTLQEINVSAEAGTYITNYDTVDASPTAWDGVITSGAAAKAFRRLATDGLLWRNFLIFQDGSAAQQMAVDAAQSYSTFYDSLRFSVKRAYYLALPSDAFTLFTNTGFGFLNTYGKYRGLRINRLSNY